MADHPKPGLVEDRDLDRRAAGVVRPDPADYVLVLGRALGVLGTPGLVPLPGRGRGVVLGDVLDLHVSGHVVPLLQSQRYGVGYRLLLRPRRALQRQVTHYGSGRTAPSFTTALLSAIATTSRYKEHRGYPQNREHPYPTPSCHPASSSQTYKLPNGSHGARSLGKPATLKALLLRLTLKQDYRPARFSLSTERSRHGPWYTRCSSCRSGGIGRRAGLKIRFPPGSVGSSPTSGTRHIFCKWAQSTEQR